MSLWFMLEKYCSSPSIILKGEDFLVFSFCLMSLFVIFTFHFVYLQPNLLRRDPYLLPVQSACGMAGRINTQKSFNGNIKLGEEGEIRIQ